MTTTTVITTDNNVTVVDNAPNVTVDTTTHVVVIDGGGTGGSNVVGTPYGLSIGTVSSGVTPSATITGAAPSQVLSLVLPKGDQGAQGAQGPQGPQGPIGNTGATGNGVLYGSTNPTSATGSNGDFYINTSTNYIFGPKVAGSWPVGVSIVGPQGSQGVQGAQGIQGIQGPQGAQGATGAAGVGITSITRISGNGAPGTTDTYQILYTNASTTQYSVYNGANGATGSTGATGAAGNTILSGSGVPLDAQGANGDFYIDTATTYLYGPKASGVWPATGTNLRGQKVFSGINPAGSTNAGSVFQYSGSGTSRVVTWTITHNLSTSAGYIPSAVVTQYVTNANGVSFSDGISVSYVDANTTKLVFTWTGYTASSNFAAGKWKAVLGFTL